MHLTKLRTLGLVAALLALAVAAFILQREYAKARHHRIVRDFIKDKGHGAGKLMPDDVAPDFLLKRQGAEAQVSLSSFRGKKPVALIFGSYT